MLSATFVLLMNKYCTPTIEVLALGPSQIIAGWDSQSQSPINPNPGGSEDFAVRRQDFEWESKEE